MTARAHRATRLTELQRLRSALGRSQRAFAADLGVSAESYRTWESGRRPPPDGLVVAARRLTASTDGGLLSLKALADLLGVHRRTLQQAARDGRLAVVYHTRPVFGHLVPRATRAAGEAYMRTYYRRTRRWNRPPPPPRLPQPPLAYVGRILRLRRYLGLSQGQLAARVGAAGKAVVCQWETGRRRPSPVLWQRLLDLEERR